MIDAHLITSVHRTQPIAACLTAMLGRLVADGAALGWIDPPAQDEIERLLAAAAQGVSDGSACGVLARDGEDVVGFGFWARFATPTQRQNADLDKLAVAPAVAGAGLGRRLLRLLLEEARRHGVEQMTLDLRDGNSGAEHLYLSEGFREVGRLPEFVDPGDGRRVDKLLLLRDLRAPASSSSH